MADSTAEADRLIVASDAHHAILSHAREATPEEAVGVVIGERADPDRVSRVERARNAAATPESRYALDPVEQLSVLESVEDAGDEVVGFYHSHPRGPEVPSATDEARATWDGYVYAIASLAEGPTLRAWRWTGEQFTPLALTVES
jgi:proteasome lid subunit RPN8/RPN11